MSRTSRRQFAKTLTAAGALLPLGALAQTTTEEPRNRATAQPSLGKALTEVVKAQYRQYLDDGDLERLGTTLQEHATLLERLRAFELKNSDEPDFTFSSLTKRW